MHTLFFLMLDLLLIGTSSTSDAFGSVKWTYSTDNRIYATPTIEKEILYVGSLDKSMYAIHTKNGKWSSSVAPMENCMRSGVDELSTSK